ncbi:CPBP family intramembrane glutamic endopeptidase [Paenibacillus chartarius]|uniref:CPBP family intramembrane glutamic endopeptidase n=1 Tax=Paenibacillus chartarius TaxID=747481 RepID=A0ABV6DF96_9BACL
MKLFFNRNLLLLAALGVFLYGAVIGISSWLKPGEAGTEKPVVSKREAAEAALAFARERFGVGEADTFVTYRTHQLRSTYLERKTLADTYEKKYGDKYPIEYFTVEIRSKSGDQHRFIDVNYTNKQILGWAVADDVLDARLKANPDRTKSETVASAELKRLGYDPGDFTLMSRTDQRATLFLFESKSVAIGDAKLQLEIDADEREVFGFSPVFVVPQEHIDWKASQDWQASLMTWVSLGFMFLMAVAGFIYAIVYRKQISFARGALLTLIYAVFYCTNNLNMFPAFKAESGTAASQLDIIAISIFMNFVTLLLTIGVYVSFVSGAELWRRTGWNPWPRWREAAFGAEVWVSMGRGYLICLFILGVQQVLFFVAEHGFGIWAVADASNSPLNMLVPSLFPLLAWCAAISEEATFRLFGIAFFERIVRWRFAAVLLPSIIWAASHTQYPIYPVYTRLVEVTILGIIFGYVFLKYGFMTVMFAHATMDLLLMGLDLLVTGSGADIGWGLFHMASPLLIAAVLAWLHGRSQRRRRPGILEADGSGAAAG